MLRKTLARTFRIFQTKQNQPVRHYNTANKMEKKTLNEFGYAFNSDGQLRKIGSDGQPGDEPFQFNVSSQHHECQAHYEEVGDAVTDYIYQLLEKEEKLHRLPIPKDAGDNGTFIFVSKDYDKKDTLMLLINGSGAVRAGQWARSLIINDCLNTGTQIPYIRKAISKDYGVMILNTNDNYGPDGKKIPNSSSAEEHALYAWKSYVRETKASSIVIVAHSYGGIVTFTLANELKDEFEKRVKAIAFTDSVHNFANLRVSNYLKKVARNWISSTAPLDAPMKTPDYDIERISAGHPKHEMTSYACMESVFKYFDEQLSQE